MKQLVLRNTIYEKIYRALGIVLLIIVIIVIITGDKSEWSFWLQVLLPLLFGLALISMNFGTLVNRLTAENGQLIIRWNTKFVSVRVRIEEIEEILADEYSIRIILKNGRKVRLSTGMLDFNEKKAVRKFLKETTGF